MNVRDNDDPFASITKRCHISSSQEALFQNCPFARQSQSSDDSSPESNEPPVESTPIEMITPPSDYDTPRDVFETPPEEATVVSFDEQRIKPNINRGVDDETMAVDDGCTDGERTVDLGRDSDLGFSEVKISAEQRTATVDGKADRGTMAVDDVCTDGERTVDLSKDYDLGFSEVKISAEQRSATVDGKADQGIDDGTLGVDDVGTDVEMMEVTKHVVSCNDVNEVVVESECEENDGDLEFVEEIMNEDLEVRESEEGVRNGVNNGAGSSSAAKPLPNPLVENLLKRVNNGAGSSSAANRQRTNPLVKNLLKALEMLAEKWEPDPSLDELDLVQIAERRGMIFPKPIWTPPMGFEDEE